ncbi:DUF6233 domain-containing protein [Streptomyces albogriseolus]|uniref:DUF6233 domain-containing protein n=1 Tax=Streptomyces albogriseolus TaxID=1887 RepID=UPI003F49EE92
MRAAADHGASTARTPAAPRTQQVALVRRPHTTRPSAKRSKGISRDEALWALTNGVKACGACRPDSELGYLEG